MILVTGSDSSLGRVLMKNPACVGIPSPFLHSKTVIEQTIDKILAKHSITHVINNYGINKLSWIGMTAEADERILLDNVMIPYWVINHFVHLDIVCRVINIASATYRVPQRCTTLYCASKAAVVQMTKVMARELAPKGWIINCLAPGLIEDTSMAKKTNDQVKNLRGWTEEQMNDYALKLIPMGRFTNCDEVAKAIFEIFLLPDYINGATIEMMGGV